MSLTDTQKFWRDVKRAGTTGAHSHDLAASIPSLNVSQRAKDCTTKGQQVYVKPEARNGRQGARFWLEGFQPDDATAVRPNQDFDGRDRQVRGAGSSNDEVTAPAHQMNGAAESRAAAENETGPPSKDVSESLPAHTATGAETKVRGPGVTPHPDSGARLLNWTRELDGEWHYEEAA